MIVEYPLLRDGALSVADIRCVDAPTPAGDEERAPATEVVIPLDGLFVRIVRRPGSRGGPTATICDATRALVFRDNEPYRVAHPAGGHDRSLVISVHDPALGQLVADRAVSPVIQVLARRLIRALADGSVDGLTGAEVALALLGAIGQGGSDAGSVACPVRSAGREPRPAERRMVGLVRLIIATRLGERATLPDLGREVGLSGWELARRFRRVTGVSIHRYRMELRVQAALERIDAGERDLTVLALDLGFADHSHLTNVIRRETGRPPSAFRRSPGEIDLRGLRTILQA